MCLGLPGQIVEVKSNLEVVADFWGLRKTVRLDNLAEPVLAGDYIIDHGGYAVRVIPAEDVAGTVALYEILLTEAGEDPIACEAGAGIEEALAATAAELALA
jgi:hydrogenase expression/formation protein HypC